jgi:hypothetical protein
MADGTHDHKPRVAALQDVMNAFAQAPVNNPADSEDGAAPGSCSDGIDNGGGDGADINDAECRGITLHLLVDEAVAEITPLRFSSDGPGPADDFNDLKLGTPRAPCGTAPTVGRFGAAADRASLNCGNILEARRQAFRYAIFGHSHLIAGVVGEAELPGNDLVVTLGGASQTVIQAAGGLRAFTASTFMHELGHTLALHHGGGDGINCKPNYLSIMQYALTDKDLDPTRPLDYSRQALAPLDENTLVESAGVGGPANRNVVYGGLSGRTIVVPANGPIDWNDNGSITPFPVLADINHVAAYCGLEQDTNGDGVGDAPRFSTLTSFNDWERLQFNVRLSPDYADREVRTTVPAEPEKTYGQILNAAQSVDVDGDGFTNFPDTCPAVPNPDQQDTEGDGVGDACDNCPTLSNPGQEDSNGNGIGDACEPMAVSIDIKPGSFPNSINLGSGGTVPVAIFSAATFDATTVDPLTVTLASAWVQLKGKGTPMASFEDVNQDGRLDLVVHVETQTLQLSSTDTTATLEGTTSSGLSIQGVDTVRVVP